MIFELRYICKGNKYETFYSYDCFLKALNALQEEVVIDVLQMVLNKKPTLSDAKLCTKVYMQGNYFEYGFSYKGKVLGQISISNGFVKGLGLQITFTPQKKKHENSNL